MENIKKNFRSTDWRA